MVYGTVSARNITVGISRDDFMNTLLQSSGWPGKLIFLIWNLKNKSSDLVQMRPHSPAHSTLLQINLETNGIQSLLHEWCGTLLWPGRYTIC